MIDRNAIWDRARRVWSAEAGELERLAGTVDREALARCVEVLAGCRGRIVTSGAGTSAAAARKIAHSLSCVERPAFFLSPADAVHGALGAVQPGDTAILISKGGGTREVVGLLPALERKQVFVIGVTEREDSALGRAADLLLKVRVEREADDFDMLATSSAMAVTAVFDAVCVALAEATGFTKEQFAVIHPGGAVGERLLRGGSGPEPGGAASGGAPGAGEARDRSEGAPANPAGLSPTGSGPGGAVTGGGGEPRPGRSGFGEEPGSAADRPVPGPPRIALPFLKEKGVAQLGFVVRDLDRTVEQYCQRFGIGPWHFYTYGKPLVPRMTYRGRPADYRMRIALSWIGPLRIELIEPVEGESVYEEFIRDHGYGIHHLGVLVEDMAAALALAREAGLEMAMDGAGFGLDGDGHYAYLDTEAQIGTTLELIERPARRVDPEKVYPPEPPG